MVNCQRLGSSIEERYTVDLYVPGRHPHLLRDNWQRLNAVGPPISNHSSESGVKLASAGRDPVMPQHIRRRTLNAQSMTHSTRALSAP